VCAAPGPPLSTEWTMQSKNYLTNRHYLHDVIHMIRNRVSSLISVAVVLLMVFQLLPAADVVSADTENRFGDGSTERSVTFDDAGSDNSTTIKLNYLAEVTDASLKLAAGDNGGDYLFRPAFFIENTRLWSFDGNGFGHFGEQTVFTDNSTSSSLSFPGEGSKTSYIYLPKNASVTSATLDISGRESAGAMTPPEVLSQGTLITSNANNPAMAADGSDLYMVWVDDGDLDYAGKDYDIFFKRSTDNGQTWGKAVCLSDSGTGSQNPSIAVNGNNLYVVWAEDDFLNPGIQFRMSKDGGGHWGEIVQVTDKADWGAAPVVSVSGTSVYVVWAYSGEIYFGYSDDGEEWKTKQISEEGSSNSVYAYDPWVASRGSYVYAAWREVDQDTRENRVAFKNSDDNGQNFQEKTTHIRATSSSEYIYDPAVACDENGHVYAAWREYNPSDVIYDLYYSYSQSDGDDGSWSSPDKIDDTDESIYSVAISSEKEAGVNYVYAAWYDRNNVSFVRSTDESTWSSSTVLMPYNGYDTALAANDDGHVYAACAAANETSGLFNSDVYINISSDRGSNWDDWALISSELFDGLSGAAAADVSGDQLYLVWEEHGNISGVENGVEGDIFFRHYDGNSWSGVTVLSDASEDGTSAFPDIAVDGQNIYVVWHEYGNISGQGEDADIVFRYSSNGGQDWGATTVLSDDPNDGNSIYPKVGIAGSTGYVVWYDNGNVAGSGTDNDVLFRKINSGTPDLTGTMVLSQDSTGTSQNPDIVVDGSNVYTVWQDSTDIYESGRDADIFFRKSTNNGNSWNDIVVVSQTASYSYDPVISMGDYIYVVWRESYPTFSRSVNGDTWSEQKRASTQTGYDIDMASYGEEVYLAYRYSTGLYIVSSGDAGDNWDSPVDVSTDNSSSSQMPALGYDNDVLHLFWADAGNISGSGYDSDIIYRHSISSNPANVTLDIDGDGAIEWEWPGELNEDNSPQTYSGSGFVNALNDAIESGEVYLTSYGNEIVRIRMVVTSDEAGVVTLDNMKIDYDYSAVVDDYNYIQDHFSDALNNYIQDHQDEHDDDGNIEIPLRIETGSGGKITFSDLYVEYTVKKYLTIVEPDGGGFYTGALRIGWEAENFEDEDDVNIYFRQGGSEWTLIDTVNANGESYDWTDASQENGKNYRIKVEYTEDEDVFDRSDYFGLDNYPPTTTPHFDFENEYTEDGAATDETVWGSKVTVSFTRNDRFEGGDGGSGVNHTYYRIDGGDWEEYGGSFDIETHGESDIEFYSEDKMDNTEQINSETVHVDALGPEYGSWQTPSVDSKSRQDQYLEVRPYDNDSGLKENSIVLDYYIGEESPNYWNASAGQWLHVRWYCIDNVANKGFSDVKKDYIEDLNKPDMEITEDDIRVEDSQGAVRGTELETAGIGDIVYILADVVNRGEVEGNADIEILIDGNLLEGLNRDIGPGSPEAVSVQWDTDGYDAGDHTITVKVSCSEDENPDNDEAFITFPLYAKPDAELETLWMELDGEETSTVYQEETVVLKATVNNIGGTDAENVVVRFYLDDLSGAAQLGDDVELGTLAASQGQTAALNWETGDTPTGSHKIYAKVFSDEDYDTETNNLKKIDITVEAPRVPALEFASNDISFKVSGNVIVSANIGETVTIEATVENIGTADSGEIAAEFRRDSKTGEVIGDDTGSVKVGETATFSITWDTTGETGDPVDIYVVITGDDLPQEFSASKKLIFEKGGGDDDGDKESSGSMSVILPIIIIVIGAGAAGALYMLKFRKEEEDFGGEWGDAGYGGADEGATGAAAVTAAAPKQPAKKRAIICPSCKKKIYLGETDEYAYCDDCDKKYKVKPKA